MALEVYELTLSGNLGGQFVQNILHISLNNSSSVDPYGNAVDLLETFNQAGALQELFTLACPASYGMTSMRCRRVSAGGGATAILLAAALVEPTGQRAGPISVSSNSPLLLLLTNQRPNRLGRIFIPGVSESDIDNNVLVAGLVTALQNIGVELTSGGVTLASGDAWNGCVYRRAIDVGDSLLATRVSTTVGSQRRRQKPN